MRCRASDVGTTDCDASLIGVAENLKGIPENRTLAYVSLRIVCRRARVDSVKLVYLAGATTDLEKANLGRELKVISKNRSHILNPL